MKRVRGHLVAGTLWLSIARALTSALAFLSTLVLARLLMPADFGLVALSTTMLAMLSAVTNLSLSAALVQHQAPTPTHLHTAWTFDVSRGLLIAALFAACANPAAVLYDEPRLANIMLALSISVILGGFANPRAIMATKQLDFRQQFMLQVAEKLASTTAAVGMAVIYRSYWALVIGALVGQLASVILSYIAFPFRPKLSIQHGRELLSFSIWLTFGQIVNTINWRFDQLLVGTYLGSSALGYYAVGSNIATIPTREATSPLAATLFPAFSSFAGDRPRLVAGYQAAQSLVTAIALPLGVGMATIADPLVRLTMGEAWVPAVIVIQALASVFAIQTLGSMSQPLAMATGSTKLLFARDLQGLAMRVPLIICGMYLYGLPGIVWARVATGLIGIAFNLNVVTKILGLTAPEQVRPNARSLISVATMATAVITLNSTLIYPESPGGLASRVAASFIVGGGVYIGFHWALWVAAMKPAGPEQEIIRIMGEIKQRLSKSSQT